MPGGERADDDAWLHVILYGVPPDARRVADAAVWPMPPMPPCAADAWLHLILDGSALDDP
jgi:hypothetical protein